MKFHSHRALPTFFVIVLGVLLLAGEAQAAILTWNCTNDVWSNTACWNPNSIPTGSDTVYVPTVSSSNTLLTIDGTTGAAIAGTVYIDASVGTTVTLQQTASSLGATWEYVGYSGSGAFTQSGGVNGVNYLVLGYNSGSNGTYNLSDTGTLSANGSSEYIGWAGTGTLQSKWRHEYDVQSFP